MNIVIPVTVCRPIIDHVWKQGILGVLKRASSVTQISSKTGTVVQHKCANMWEVLTCNMELKIPILLPPAPPSLLGGEGKHCLKFHLPPSSLHPFLSPDFKKIFLWSDSYVPGIFFLVSHLTFTAIFLGKNSTPIL